ncbi:TM2 domain-containing protein 3 [Ictalurus punctatus]|uniref:TM2 domain-containing protein 3 n=1 Tax=Ictalurus punctatus TaxID=7998 RepID=A0A979ES87_ICTPU|nr:TM2 domain-containing protein 3 [Ictalurus punctatus]
MVANGFKWIFQRGRGIMRKYGVLFLLLADVFFKSSNGYLSSAHVGQDTAYTPQHGPAVPGPVRSASPPPAAAAAAAATSSSSSSSHSSSSSSSSVSLADVENHEAKCPSRGLCNKLPADCFTCAYHHNCSYGRPANFTCKTKDRVHCVDASGRNQTVFNLTVDCRFCWQLDPAEYRCNISTTCMTVSCPRKRYNATCTVMDHVNCLGKREFQKRLFCNWTGGYKWSTALTLSITLGGFGADRFYLGQWREGLGKLFSFGGLGIWTLIDVLLIAVGYVGPADGSLYI